MSVSQKPQRLENHFTVGREAIVNGVDGEHRGTIVAVINEPLDGIQRVEIETEDGVVNTDKDRVEVL